MALRPTSLPRLHFLTNGNGIAQREQLWERSQHGWSRPSLCSITQTAKQQKNDEDNNINEMVCLHRLPAVRVEARIFAISTVPLVPQREALSCPGSYLRGHHSGSVWLWESNGSSLGEKNISFSLLGNHCGKAWPSENDSRCLCDHVRARTHT